MKCLVFFIAALGLAMAFPAAKPEKNTVAGKSISCCWQLLCFASNDSEGVFNNGRLLKVIFVGIYFVLQVTIPKSNFSAFSVFLCSMNVR